LAPFGRSSTARSTKSPVCRPYDGSQVEALSKRDAKRNGSAPAPHQFGSPGRAPAELGRRGGVASGRSRQQRPLRLLEAKILASSNGAAAMKLLEIKRRELAERKREHRRADELVCQLLDEADAERQTIRRLRERRREYET